MDTTVRPLDVAKVVIAEKANPKIVEEGLKILKLCAENRDLVRRKVGEMRFGELIEGFIRRVQTDDNPDKVIRDFPEWAVTLNGETVATDFLHKTERVGVEIIPFNKVFSPKSTAAGLINEMAGSMMLLETILENPELVDPTLLETPEMEQLKALAKSVPPSTYQDILKFMVYVCGFYNYIRRLRTDPVKYSPNVHRVILSHFMEMAKLAMEKLPDHTKK